MADICNIWLADAEKTTICGGSLASTLYKPVDIYLVGEIGAGKTTFLHGFSSALGITQYTQSPTYALENRYEDTNFGDYIHIDLYRLEPTEAMELLEQSQDTTGIRCIEWANRLPKQPQDGIHICIEDNEDGRMLTCSFADIAVPSAQQIQKWQQDVQLPENVIRHCNAVAKLCGEYADSCMQNGFLVRKNALIAAAMLHDLLRFIDFVPGAAHDASYDDRKQPEIWTKIMQKFTNQTHEQACSTFLQEQHFAEIGKIIEVHGLQHCPTAQSTLEQKILYYADKRCIVDTKVSLKERFHDFAKRYNNGTWSTQQEQWYKQTQVIEQDLQQYIAL